MVVAYILINVAIGKVDHVMSKLREIENVKSIAVVAGEFDLIVRVEVKSLEKLFDVTEKIHRIDGITKTTTHIVEKEIRAD